MELEAILYQIDSGDMALPEFQRGYVWNRDQVRGLMTSLYRRYPVGSLLVWVTATEKAPIRAGGNPTAASVRMLLDGQQRITTLYGIIRGKPPAFFEGDQNAFTGLRFHLASETFEFYAPAKMATDPLWIDVSKLMQKGLAAELATLPPAATEEERSAYINRLNQVAQIAKIDLHIEEVIGADKNLDVVVDIFNRVNSGGTKLSKGDLALAKLCAEWPDARQSLRSRLAVWQTAGFKFRLEWLLRAVTTLRTGQAFFTGLENVLPDDFKTGLDEATEAINYLLNLVSARLGLDHDRVLGGRYAFPVMARLVVESGGKLTGAEEQGKLLYWYVHSFLWGRYAGSTESKINQDLTALKSGGLNEMIEVLRRSRADLTIRPEDFTGNSRGARFYPLLYLMSRTGKARDLAAGGLELSAHMLGKLAKLQVHHIFPKAKLYAAKYARGEVNAIANFCFLSQGANLEILDKAPHDYFLSTQEKFPGALESQWIPTDPALWTVDHYEDFLAERRKLLAEAANELLDALIATPAPAATEVLATLSIVAHEEGEEKDQEAIELDASVTALVERFGLAVPTAIEVVVDPQSGDELGLADFLWADGLQGGYDEPVVLVVDGDPKETERMAAGGCRVFHSVEALEAMLTRRSEELAG